MNITRVNEFQANVDQSEELHTFLKSLLPYILSSQGCISCEILCSLDQVGKFILIEKWQSISHHKKSIENFPKEEMQAAMSLFGAPPKGHYYQE